MNEHSGKKARGRILALAIGLLIGLDIVAGGLDRIKRAIWTAGTVLQIAVGISAIVSGILVFRFGGTNKATVLATALLSVLLFSWLTAIFIEVGIAVGYVLSGAGLIIALVSWGGFWMARVAEGGEG